MSNLEKERNDLLIKLSIQDLYEDFRRSHFAAENKGLRTLSIVVRDDANRKGYSKLRVMLVYEDRTEEKDIELPLTATIVFSSLLRVEYDAPSSYYAYYEHFHDGKVTAVVDVGGDLKTIALPYKRG